MECQTKSLHNELEKLAKLMLAYTKQYKAYKDPSWTKTAPQ